MTKTRTTRYNVAAHLRTPEEMAAYLEACLEEANGDAAFIAKAMGDIARAKGMSQVARDAGLSRESLYKALSETESDLRSIRFLWRTLLAKKKSTISHTSSPNSSFVPTPETNDRFLMPRRRRGTTTR